MDERTSIAAALREAVEVIGGGQVGLASAIGLQSPRPGAVVWAWIDKGCVPPEHCPAIERETRRRGRPVICERLCPSVDWGVLRLQVEEPQDEPAAG